MLKIETTKQKIAVLGAGLTGRAMVDWFLKNDHVVYLFDDFYHQGISDYVMNHSKKENLTFIGKPKYPYNFDSFDAVLLSPSFKLDKAYIHSGINYKNFYTELDYFYPYLKEKCVFSVTGTNGKTSTVKLLAHLLEKQGHRVFLGGNVGVPIVHMLEKDADKDYDMVVLELSSFQLFYTKTFKTDYSILLNLSPDHLKWHTDFQEYAEAKLKLAKRTKTQAYVHDDFLPYFKGKNEDWAKNVIGFNQNFVTGIDKEKIAKNKLAFFVNFIPLIAILKTLGMSFEAMIEGINALEWVKYRLTEKSINKWLFVNDSKSTNIESTLFAIEHYQQSILILGGDDKGLDYSVFNDALKGKTKEILVFGGLKEKLLKTITIEKIKGFDTLNDVFVYLKTLKSEKETVLFSPCSSSFDLYQNYVKRGEHFDQLVGEFFE